MTNRAELQRIAEQVFDHAGTIDRPERLDETLAADPALRESWDELLAARAALAGAGLEEAPHDLRPAILRAVAAEARQRRNRGSWLEALVASLRARPALAMSTALMAGIVIGGLALATLTGGFDAGNRFAPSAVATMLAAPAAAAPVVLDVDGAHLEARVARADHGNDMVVRVDLRSAHGADVMLAWEPGTLVLHTVHGAPGGLPVIRSGAGELTLQAGGSGTTLLVFGPGRGPGGVRVTLRAGSGLREGTLSRP